MQIEKFKDVTIEGREFRIGRIPAIQGTWIVRAMSTGIGSMSQETYFQMQQQWLDVVSVYKETGGTKVPMRVFGGGKWMVPDLDLEYDVDLIWHLFEAVTDFNFGDFFRKRAKEIQAESAVVNEEAVSAR